MLRKLFLLGGRTFKSNRLYDTIEDPSYYKWGCRYIIKIEFDVSILQIEHDKKRYDDFFLSLFDPKNELDQNDFLVETIELTNRA